MSYWDDMTIDLPEMEIDGLSIKRFEVVRDSFANFKLGHRRTRPGWYTGLMLNGQLWMSDTDAEKQDHMPALGMMRSWQAKRVIINGLGLGMVLKAALKMDHVEHIDVVEKDERVLNLVGPHYAKDSRVHLHHADAYEQMKVWDKGTRWDVGWTDIWADVSTDTLEEMTKFRRFYGRRCEWHDCWAREQLVDLRRKEQREERQRQAFAASFRRWANSATN